MWFVSRSKRAEFLSNILRMEQWCDEHIRVFSSSFRCSICKSESKVIVLYNRQILCGDRQRFHFYCMVCLPQCTIFEGSLKKIFYDIRHYFLKVCIKYFLHCYCIWHFCAIYLCTVDFILDAVGSRWYWSYPPVLKY